MMKNQIYIRKGMIIKGSAGYKTFDSINKAKKESHAIQMKEDGALGRGCLKVEKK